MECLLALSLWPTHCLVKHRVVKLQRSQYVHLSLPVLTLRAGKATHTALQTLWTTLLCHLWRLSSVGNNRSGLLTNYAVCLRHKFGLQWKHLLGREAYCINKCTYWSVCHHWSHRLAAEAKCYSARLPSSLKQITRRLTQLWETFTAHSMLWSWHLGNVTHVESQFIGWTSALEIAIPGGFLK